jgi:hypothetical protein
MEKRKVQIKLLGGEVKRGEKDVSPFPFKNNQALEPPIRTFQRLPSIGTFQRPPSIGTFQGPLSIRTFQRPPSIGTFH